MSNIVKNYRLLFLSHLSSGLVWAAGALYFYTVLGLTYYLVAFIVAENLNLFLAGWNLQKWRKAKQLQ